MTDIWTAGRPAKAQVIKEPAWAGEKREAPLSVVGLQIRLSAWADRQAGASQSWKSFPAERSKLGHLLQCLERDIADIHIAVITEAGPTDRTLSDCIASM